MTLKEARQATQTGFITRSGCALCKHHKDDVLQEGDWEPWTEQHEEHFRQYEQHVRQTIERFTQCSQCSQ